MTWLLQRILKFKTRAKKQIAPQVWVMLHSSSRSVGNRIGTVFIDLAREHVRPDHAHLPDRGVVYGRAGQM